MSSQAPKQTRTTAKAANKRSSAADKAGKAKKRRTIAKIGWIGGAALLIAAIAVAVANRPPKPGEKVEVMADQTHIATVTSPHKPYNSDPPTSGQHVPYIAPWGVHKEPLPKELLVHNLEDSGVVLYYSKDADPDTVEKLETIVKRYSKHVLVNPYPDMTNPITLTAWGRIDRLDGFDENRIVAFIDAYKGIDHHPRS
ncbi:DUF3105 domain-containing protein [Paenibacillus ginsengarvi]|uniref:DUF3105 domain-containing protein n=1 Tax=Paenibacillus ginsengarvi TaxID=400777 RepID=A0A3B0C7N7_9BACL|nr:DUF3105 domain-containing protein [Paenibacillus ginsengarvi]RKN79016.1 DUF3105 domain-containing protein [Paenibacillus ginsengarvi]